MLTASKIASRFSGSVVKELQRKCLPRGQLRCFGMQSNLNDYYHADEPLHPNYNIDSVKPPPTLMEPGDEEYYDPEALVRGPVKSASAVDITSKPPKLSPADTVSITKSGTLKHGRYGELDKEVVKNIPMEYLSMLHPSTEAAAALRTLGASTGGTVLIYGASQPAGLAATQLATNVFNASVIAVVDGQHAGDEELVDAIKGMASYPGTAVPESYVTQKANFRDLVNDTVTGASGAESYSVDKDFLDDFKQNLLDYCKMFPQGKAAVNPDDYIFNGKEYDRKFYKDNMEAYLERFNQGAPEIREGELEATWNKNQYAVFKSKFNNQCAELLTDIDEMTDPEFDPPHKVKEMLAAPEDVSDYILSQKPVDGGEYFPYEFNVLHQSKPDFVMAGAASPMLGAIIVATPTLAKAAEVVAKAKTVREKAEALAAMPMMDRTAFDAATHVANLATAAGKPVVVVGDYSLPNMKRAELDKSDVQTALSAMEIDDEGNSKLNFFMHVYRAGDFPIYESYAAERAAQPLAGPRQVVVLK